ncbi:MAG TPA: HAMP domain-containing sensor histidine kinase [Solirubrobacteraceae bacterium]|jgi:signal transduction histidine kinase|nr:HAMP domain-containing sensor histidine kinase [Solirubrobacteraceae bacterium]
MTRLLRALSPRSWLRASRRTARLRLTLLYTGMFLGLGTALVIGIFLLSSDGRLVHASAHAVTVSPTSTTIQPVPPNVSGHALRRLAQPGGVVDSQPSSDLAGLLATTWGLLVITAMVSALLGWFAAGRVLRPLREMTDAARTISAGNLGRRLALAGPDDEFKRLGDTLDELLARLEASFDAQRRFVANASHELRTPLTVERTLLQVALADPDATEASLRAACEELLACGREHERLLESLLTLASSERGLNHREPVDLARLAGHVLLTPRPDMQRHGLELDTMLEPAAVAGDPALLERLMVNLVDNAVHYNRSGGRVEVRTAAVNGHAAVSVTNTGPVVRPDETERLFEPFQRLGGGRAARADGHHGLGLSIVRAIAVAHDATVDAVPQPAGGLAVTVSFARLDGAAAPHSP